VDCPKKNEELWIDHVAGVLAPDVELQLRRHLDACAFCREAVEAQRAVWTALDSLTPVPVSPGFDEAVYRRIADEDFPPQWRRIFQAHWSWRPAMPLAAAGVALIAALLLRTPATERPSAVPVVSTPQIEQIESALEDMDMLKQLGVAAPQESLSTASDEL
jgi:anti-sigma factor RsiW